MPSFSYYLLAACLHFRRVIYTACNLTRRQSGFILFFFFFFSFSPLSMACLRKKVHGSEERGMRRGSPDWNFGRH